jgi:hypothetical protein
MVIAVMVIAVMVQRSASRRYALFPQETTRTCHREIEKMRYLLPLPMTCYRAVVLVSMFCLVCAAAQTAWPQAGTITPAMQNNCANDYKQFCGDYGLQTSALNLCMRKAGPKLSPACVRALVQAGKVSQAEVDRVKAQMKGR